ncbi:BON domain-containing protein [Nitratireductor sp. ZSWI3]|uniref:BON domain-containing protein n=1 Tax=Nitratireductor sp. ZSWI3 TaxID=2966359 RepID=UPI00214FCDB3|nr:BON domain-containing protein [Nitratireductor sp. ZSWI3]MCR4264684.1 BON domain-containing protein [Nitratireductor sp. ZSWI3]
MAYERQWEQDPPRQQPDGPGGRDQYAEPTGGAWWSEETAAPPPPAHREHYPGDVYGRRRYGQGYGAPYSYYGWPARGLYPARPSLGYGGGYGGRYGGRPYRSDYGERDFWDRASDEVSSWFGDEEAEQRRWRDRHRGKGPKGYVRSDERVHEDVNDRLAEDGMLDASDIEVTVDQGEVTLSGTVADRFEKRRAEDCADSVSGVRHTQNNLRIQASSMDRPDM